MSKTIENQLDLLYVTNVNMLAELVSQAQEKKDSERLQEMARAISEVFFYVNGLQMERWAYNKTISDARKDRNRAIIRARKADGENEKLQKQLDELKDKSLKGLN
tara:strand:- start:4287 stop:4601 length:315 start_codon:yes stop_codon:yes gene_type:complete